MGSFMMAVGQAKLAKLTFLEVSPKIMDEIIMPRGLKGDYVIYDGIKVYKEGTREMLEAKDAESVLDR
jgi:hypothetical protein